MKESYKLAELHAVGRITIYRGLPGAGKSTEALRDVRRTGAIFVEPDALLIRKGEYIYTPEAFFYAQRLALSMVTLAGEAGCDVIYADVLPRRQDVDEVIRAYDRGRGGAVYPPLKVRVFHLAISAEESLEANRHHVAEEDIRRMERDWEAWLGEVIL